MNFGGPAGQIALMHHELVERRRWIGEQRFLHALSYCTLLPGPEAQQLAIYIGWLLHRTRGGIVAGIAFILPAFLLMMGLAWVYAAHGDVAWVGAIFSGLAAAVVGIVAVALVRLASRALRGPALAGIAVRRVLAIYVVGVPFPLVIGGAAAAGIAFRARPAYHGAAEDADDVALATTRWRRTTPGLAGAGRCVCWRSVSRCGGGRSWRSPRGGQRRHADGRGVLLRQGRRRHVRRRIRGPRVREAGGRRPSTGG